MKRAAILWLGLLATLVTVNMTVWGYEKLRTEGSVVYLELAPKDPRSLMQGDYMALRLAIAREVGIADADASGTHTDDAEPRPTPSQSGFVIVQPDELNIGRFVRIQPSPMPRADKEVALPFRHGRDGIQIVSSEFFFAEGRAEEFDAARYGEFRVDASGRAILTRLRDEKLKPL